MVEPIFQAPPPPPMNHDEPVHPEQATSENSANVVQNNPSETQTVQEESAQVVSQKEQVLNRLNELKENFVRYFWYSIAGLFLLGMFFGCAMSGGDNQPQKQYQGRVLTRIIENRNIRGRLSICGTVLLSEPCVFYILNSTNHEEVPESYFPYVANEMQRPPNSIKTENVLYKELIPPGYFAEIIVPAKR